MILVASQRGGARQLARHLLNDAENDHVTLAEAKGFVARDLTGALDEVHAISQGTRCRQFLFSLSLNPPKDAAVELADLIAAVDRAEERLGLKGQPRAVVIHEKQGRRHAHVVWSRIDAAQMKAINMPHFKSRLASLSRELFLEHGWVLPEGHRTNGWKNPLNFTLADWQQAKRIGLDPRELKQVFQDAWQRSDNRASFARALEEHGYYLARGDRRGFVAVDLNGEVFAVARLVGVRTKEVQARLGDPDQLKSLEAVKRDLASRISKRTREILADGRGAEAAELAPLQARRDEVIKAQRLERQKLLAGQEERLRDETKVRAARFRQGLRGVWELLTGRAAAIRRENEQDAYAGLLRDRRQLEWLFRSQTAERRALQVAFDEARARQREERKRLHRQIAFVLRGTREGELSGRAPARTSDIDLTL